MWTRGGGGGGGSVLSDEECGPAQTLSSCSAPKSETLDWAGPGTVTVRGAASVNLEGDNHCRSTPIWSKPPPLQKARLATWGLGSMLGSPTPVPSTSPLRSGWCHCVDKGLSNPVDAKRWKVSKMSTWEDQPSVTVIPQPEPLNFYGAKGPNAPKINGAYHPTASVYNGKVLYRKVAAPDIWLRYVPSADSVKQCWVVSDTQSKDANNGVGWCRCVDKGLDSPLLAARWTILTDAGWELQPDVLALPWAPSVSFFNAPGPCAERLNGVYAPVERVYNGKTLYAKCGDEDTWLRYVTCDDWHCWVVSDTRDLEANNANGWCHCLDPGLDAPQDSTQWSVLMEDDWEDHSGIVVMAQPPPVVISGAQGPGAHRINGAYVATEQVCGFGFLCLWGVLVVRCIAWV